jgi:hypothetical protein
MSNERTLAVFENFKIRRIYDEKTDPARSLDRAREYWQQHGRSETEGQAFTG